MLAWEQKQADALLADVFGYHAVQLGWPHLQSLRSNRMPHRWLAQAEFEPPQALLSTQAMADTLPDTMPDTLPDVCLDSRAWPWPAESLDLVVLPHTLERSADPHACLRELERVLIAEGQVLITGLNPWSWWGWQQSRTRTGLGHQDCPPGALIGYRRMRDWLRLLGFEVQVSRFGGWMPALSSERWLQRLDWMDKVGERWAPILGGVYLLLATKKVPGRRLVHGRPWRTVRSPSASTLPVARSDTFKDGLLQPKDFFEPR